MRHWTRKMCIGALLLIGLHPSVNALYVEGNPLMKIDPTGLAPMPGLRIPGMPTPEPAPAAAPIGSPSSSPTKYDNGSMCLNKSCSEVRAMCRAECSETSLPTHDFGITFFRCLSACVARNGC